MEHLFETQPQVPATVDAEAKQRAMLARAEQRKAQEKASAIGALLGGIARGAAQSAVYRSIDKKHKKARRSRSRKSDVEGCTPCAAAAHVEELKAFAKRARTTGEF